jgi:hypothetical protein
MSDSLQVFEHHVCSGVNLVIPASRPDVLHPDLHVAYYHLKDQNQIIAWKNQCTDRLRLHSCTRSTTACVMSIFAL